MENRKLPVGIDSFEKLRKENFYYVDKTGLIADLMRNWGVRRFMDDETDPGGRKPAWFVFQAFGTDREDEVFEFAKDIIGIDDWDQVIYKAPIPMRPELND